MVLLCKFGVGNQGAVIHWVFHAEHRYRQYVRAWCPCCTSNRAKELQSKSFKAQTTTYIYIYIKPLTIANHYKTIDTGQTPTLKKKSTAIHALDCKKRRERSSLNGWAREWGIGHTTHVYAFDFARASYGETIHATVARHGCVWHLCISLGPGEMPNCDGPVARNRGWITAGQSGTGARKKEDSLVGPDKDEQHAQKQPLRGSESTQSRLTTN